MIFNCLFVKSKNGLFFYSVAYIREIPKKNLVIWVRPYMLPAYEEAVPEYTVKPISKTGIFCKYLSSFRYSHVFCPTSHPMPFAKKQLFVIHDLFPFLGFVGFLKFALVFLAAALSQARVGFINKTNLNRVAKFFPRSKAFFLPNLLSYDACDENSTVSKRNVLSREVVIGMFGTDSKKKNYDRLLSFLSTLPDKKIKVRIYGFNTDYLKSIEVNASQLDFLLIKQSESTVSDFIDLCDIILSDSKNEGFSRPIAMACAKSKLVFLRDSPVFREFYDETAIFYQRYDELASLLSANFLIAGDSESFKEKMNGLYKEANRSLRLFLDSTN